MTDHEDVGYMTWRDFEALQWAVNESRRLVPWLYQAGFIRTGEDVTVQTSATGYMNLAPTWLAAEEISRLLNELNQFPELEDAANDKFGQYLATQLTREVQTASYRWPYEERTHKVARLRCAGCERLSLVYRPPRFEGDAIRVDCGCGYVLCEDEFTFACELLALEEQERQKKLGVKVVA